MTEYSRYEPPDMPRKGHLSLLMFRLDNLGYSREHHLLIKAIFNAFDNHDDAYRHCTATIDAWETTR